MSISDIAFIQSFYMLAMLLFEFPSGILTDIWSEKRMYLVSLLLLVISFFIIFISESVIMLSISWFIYGISTASMSGSLESYFIRSYKNNEYKIKLFNISLNNVNLYSALIAGGVGSFIYAYCSNKIYLISTFLIFISFFITLFFFKERNGDKVLKNFDKNLNLKDIFSKLKNVADRSIYADIFLISIYQLIAQTFYQFWQVIFLIAALPPKLFGIFYVSFQLVSLVSNFIFKHIKISKLREILIVIMSALFFGAINIAETNKFLFVLFILLFLIPFDLYYHQLMVDIYKKSDTSIVGSIISFSGTMSSIVSIIFLWLFAELNKHFSLSLITQVSIISYVVFSFLTIFITKNRKIIIKNE
jgi:MFS family permease